MIKKFVEKNNKRVEKCPKCGSNLFEVRNYIKGYGSEIFEADTGEHWDSSELHESLNYREFKTANCAECNTSLGKIITVSS